MEVGSSITVSYGRETFVKNSGVHEELIRKCLSDKVSAEILKLYGGEVEKSEGSNMEYNYTLRLWVKPYDSYIKNFREASRAIRRVIKDPSLEEHILAILHHHLLRSK